MSLTASEAGAEGELQGLLQRPSVSVALRCFEEAP